MIELSAPLEGLFDNSKTLVLDFSKIKPGTLYEENFEKIFQDYNSNNLNPREPANRQQINDLLINKSGYRYLIGQYGENRSAMLADTPAGRAGRVIHMAIDVFSKTLKQYIHPAMVKLLAAITKKVLVSMAIILLSNQITQISTYFLGIFPGVYPKKKS